MSTPTAVRHTAGSTHVEIDYEDGSTRRSICADLAEARLHATRASFECAGFQVSPPRTGEGYTKPLLAPGEKLGQALCASRRHERASGFSAARGASRLRVDASDPGAPRVILAEGDTSALAGFLAVGFPGLAADLIELADQGVAADPRRHDNEIGDLVAEGKGLAPVVSPGHFARKDARYALSRRLVRWRGEKLERTAAGVKLVHHLNEFHLLHLTKTRYGDAWHAGTCDTPDQAQERRFGCGQAIEVLTPGGWMRWRFEVSGNAAALHLPTLGITMVARVEQGAPLFVRKVR